MLWALLLVAGRGLLRWFPQPGAGPPRWGLWTLGGLFALHTFLTLLDGLGWPWSRGALVVFAGGALVSNFLPKPMAGPGEPAAGPRWSWGLTLALGGAVALGWAAASLWATNPDFVYHWGVKGHRFFLAGGVDEAYLVQPWNRLAHPDSPFLQPQLFAVTALFRGFFDEAAMLLQAALWSLLTAVSARQALVAGGASRLTTESTSAAVGLCLAMFAVAHLLAGGPDVILAWVLVAFAAPLFAPRAAGEQRLEVCSGDLQMGLAAAVGAAAKVEGVPLAGAALAAYGLRQGLWMRPWPWRRLLILAAPFLVAVLPWWIKARHLDLFGRLNAGPFEAGHWQAIAPELLRSLLHPHWNGIPMLLALALPFVLLDRRVRPLVLVAAAQILLYIYVYFTALKVPEVHVRTSFTRILSHVVPALMVATTLAADRWVYRRLQKAPTSARPQTLP